MKPLSLCIPTNGIVKWVIPVLNSIYETQPNETMFEVIIADNGCSEEFARLIAEYQEKHPNIIYFKSTAQGFLCQIDCFLHAQGEFVKFVNHRDMLADGALDYLLRFAEDNRNDRPVVFFSNCALNDCTCSSFDEFVFNLGYWSSWSGGLAFWQEDIQAIAKKEKYNSLFPHTDMLFMRRSADKYIIDNSKLFVEIDADHSTKGKYNLFKAFAVEFLSVIGELLRDNSITTSTFLAVKEKTLDFLANLYYDFILRKKPASYSFENYKDYLLIYYSKGQIFCSITKKIGSRVFKRIIKQLI